MKYLRQGLPVHRISASANGSSFVGTVLISQPRNRARSYSICLMLTQSYGDVTALIGALDRLFIVEI